MNLLTSKHFQLEIDEDRQTITSLKGGERPKTFEFACVDTDIQRKGDYYHQLGDISISIRNEIDREWKEYRTAVEGLMENCPLDIKRSWKEDDQGTLVFCLNVRNQTQHAIEIGSLGIAMIFNHYFTGKTLDESHQNCTFSDPYIGLNAGYLQVTRLNGWGPVLLILPEKGTAFEAYRPINSDPTPKDVSFEGFYEWVVHSLADTELNWDVEKQWNEPTSRILQPGKSYTYGLRFLLAPSIEKIECTLIENKHPVAIGFPGYVLPKNESSKLFIHTNSEITDFKVNPEGALAISSLPDTKHGWSGYHLSSIKNGRIRLLLEYENGDKQTIHYFGIPSQKEAVQKLAQFHQEKQWLKDIEDPFKRAFSYISYDREADKMILDEERTFISGLSDEPGAGPNLLMAIKNLHAPDPEQVNHLELYARHALWGNLQNKNDYGIHASLYHRDDFWDKERGMTTWRAYNYPHQAAIYWCLYRLARNYDHLVEMNTWEWYLKQAYLTVMAMQRHCGKDKFLHLEQFGLMVGSVHRLILLDLLEEGWTEEANEFERYMRKRADIWRSLKYPFGSEMPWDSTGQEEVYIWCKHFGDQPKAGVTLNAIRAYQPLIPHWGYNGSARRYFDSFVYGKWKLIGRVFHHYAASLNAIPLMDAYLDNPEDLMSLRRGYAGSIGVLANINHEGHGSMGFIANPDVMEFEPYTSDYGQAFYGYAYNVGSFLYFDQEFGWLPFGCEMSETEKEIKLYPRDAFRQKVFFAPWNVLITLETGEIEEVVFKLGTKSIEIIFSKAREYLKHARLHVKVDDKDIELSGKKIRGAYEIPLSKDINSTIKVDF